MPSIQFKKTGPEKRTVSPDRVVSVLAISPCEEDHVALRNIFSHSNWKIRTARSWREARICMHAEPAPVVLCESRLSDADWKEVLEQLEIQPDRPLLIVSSRTADDSLWSEVLNLGGYDVLMKPYDQNEVVRVVSLAWLNWKHKHEAAERKPVGSARSGRLAAAGA